MRGAIITHAFDCDLDEDCTCGAIEVAEMLIKKRKGLSLVLSHGILSVFATTPDKPEGMAWAGSSIFDMPEELREAIHERDDDIQVGRLHVAWPEGT